MVLLTTDDLRNIFTKEDFSNTKTYSDYEIGRASCRERV